MEPRRVVVQGRGKNRWCNKREGMSERSRTSCERTGWKFFTSFPLSKGRLASAAGRKYSVFKRRRVRSASLFFSRERDSEEEWKRETVAGINPATMHVLGKWKGSAKSTRKGKVIARYLIRMNPDGKVIERTGGKRKLSWKKTRFDSKVQKATESRREKRDLFLCAGAP